MTTKDAEERRAIDYKVTFGSESGKRVLNDILIKGNVFTAIDATDPIESARLEGMRRMALIIASYVRFAPEAFREADREPTLQEEFMENWKASY